ncbi:VQ motif-containing protein 22-like [Cynara cardunculus var. scolymus]|uniref:VQ motif-containing protein 22-like n=1 Tax=Cynara cardunculus var. scolymus TaxID=59895 RepID=UPI000D62A3EC|nr:VQ motif-containing protein 22-like [Cynara cardunculus var. scolymus]
MNGMNPFSTDQWIQQYPNTSLAPSSGNPSNPATTTPVHNDSSYGTTGQSGPKPIRRRSRASRKTPTTLLNASPTDFRALVQRFTGCDSSVSVSLPSASAAVSVANLPKGPLNIDFGRNDHVNGSSSRYTYFDNQMRSSSLPVGGYGREDGSAVYEAIDESSLMATERDGGSHGYNV